jgi:hypothetical protein
MNFVWMNLDQNLFKDDSRNAVSNGSRNGVRGLLMEVTKLNRLKKLYQLIKEK